MMTRAAPLLAVALLGANAALSAAAETAVPFRDLTLDAAGTAAAKEGKLVFIDFYTTWCGPCKMLEAQTWTDAGVGKLVGDKAVPLKLDAEKEGKRAAKRYKINAYPTLLLLKPDGTEIDRIVGFREPGKFIEEFSAALAGKTALTRAEDAASNATSNQDAVQARYQLGKQLARSGRNEEALDQFLWCFDEGMIDEPGFAGVRLSFLLSDIKQLGRGYPEAMTALVERRDAAQQDMLADAGNRRAGADFASLNQALGDDTRTLQVFDQLPAGDARRASMGYSVFKLLLKARRYADALTVKPYDHMARQYDMFLAMSGRAMSDGIRDANHRVILANTADDIEALAGAGDTADALTLGAKLLEFDHGAETRELLHERAARAGHPELFSDAAAKL